MIKKCAVRYMDFIYWWFFFNVWNMMLLCLSGELLSICIKRKSYTCFRWRVVWLCVTVDPKDISSTQQLLQQLKASKEERQKSECVSSLPLYAAPHHQGKIKSFFFLMKSPLVDFDLAIWISLQDLFFSVFLTAPSELGNSSSLCWVISRITG